MLAELTKYGGLTAIVTTCLVISWIDYHEHRIPNRLTGPLAAGTALWVLLLGAVTGELGSAAIAMVVGMAIAAGMFATSLATNGIGMGDVKLAAPVAGTLAWLGRNASVTAIITIAAASLLASAVAIARGQGLRHQIPLAPIITIGLVAGVLTDGINQ